MALDDAILTISVAAKLLNLHPRKIMLYERTKLFSSQRTNTQRRMFSSNDLDKLQFIKYLTQRKGINLQGVKILLEAISLAESKGIDLKQLLFPEFKAQKLFWSRLDILSLDISSRMLSDNSPYFDSLFERNTPCLRHEGCSSSDKGGLIGNARTRRYHAEWARGRFINLYCDIFCGI